MILFSTIPMTAGLNTFFISDFFIPKIEIMPKTIPITVKGIPTHNPRNIILLELKSAII